MRRTTNRNDNRKSRRPSGAPKTRGSALTVSDQPDFKTRGGKTLYDMMRSLCKSIDSPRALAVWLLYDAEEHDQLIKLPPVEPFREKTVEEFAFDYLVSSILSKADFLKISGSKEERAHQKWALAERRNSETNALFRLRHSGLFSFRPSVEHVLDVARQKIGDILGDIDDELIRTHCHFGPGADMSTWKWKTSAYNKFASPGSSTPWVVSLYDEIYSEYWVNDYLHQCELVRGNKHFFAPKNAEIYRSACKEPRWNVFIQLGIGESIVDKFRWATGIDLRDQSRNRSAASVCHVSGTVTVDMSMASDLAAKLMVLDMFPIDWVDLFFSTRSPYTLYKGAWQLQEKVSSMGNGYTFALESVLFYSVAFAATRVCGEDVSVIRVFGDDVILPAKSYPLFRECIEAIGFVINESKTCLGPHFFESCGTDYFKGDNVRPVFVKKPVSTVTDHIILVNKVSEYARRVSSWRGDSDVADSRFLKIWKGVVHSIPKDERLYGSIGVSGTIHVPFDWCQPVHASRTWERAGWEGYLVQAYTVDPSRYFGSSFEGHLFSKLCSGLSGGQHYSVRGHGELRKKNVYVQSYVDYVWG